MLTVWASGDSYEVLHDQTLMAGSVLDNDWHSEMEPLTAALVSGPAQGTLNFGAGGYFSYEPPAHFTGTVSFTYSASFGSESAQATATINVTNNAPVAIDESDSVLHDQALSRYVNSYDVDGDTPTYGLVSGPSHGTLNLNSDGSFYYTPDTLYAGPDSFTFSVTDQIATDTGTFTINVTNNAPVAIDESDSVLHDQTLSRYVNSYDVDGDTPTYALVSGPLHGTLDLSPDGSFLYTPDALYAGPDSFTFSVTDQIATDTGTFTIDVTNNAPVAIDESDSVLHDQALSRYVNSYDVDGDTPTYGLVSGPSHGTLALSPDGSFLYTPDALYAGPDSFTFSVTDQIATDTGTFTISVTNNAPVAYDGGESALHDQTLYSWVNAYDADGDTITYSLVSGPSYGSLTLGSDGSFTYTPNGGFTDTDGFIFAAGDGIASDSATFLIHVGNGYPTLSINIIATGFVVANDDDDNENGLPDTVDAEVVGDDELVPVSIAISNPEAIDLTGYVVEVGSAGAVALWMNQKATPVPPGTQFPANSIPPLFVEGKFKNWGQVIAKLIKPGGGIGAMKDWTIEVGEIRIRRDGVDMGLGATAVWVGEKMNLDVAGKNVTGVRWFGIADSDTLKHWGQEDGGEPNDAFAQEYDLTLDDLRQREIHFHWVVDGPQKVSPSVTLVDPLTGIGWSSIYNAAKFNVKRPTIDVTTFTRDVNMFQIGGIITFVQFGNIDDPNAILRSPGIEFMRTDDPMAMPGSYKWVQLIHHVQKFHGPGNPWRVDTGGFVLDSAYPYAATHDTNDSPSTRLSTAHRYYKRDDEFEMFLMWRPATDGAIFVPLRVVMWNWGFIADSPDGHAWSMVSYHSPSPPSANTYSFPEWTANYDDFEEEADD